MDKNARRRLNRASAEKRLRYSVRKFNVGVASVAVAAFMFFGGNVVSADTLAKTDSSTTSTEKTTSVPDSGKDSGTDDSDSESAIGKDSTVATVAESNAVSSAVSTASSTSAEDLSSKVEDKTVKSEAASKSEATLKEATSKSEAVLKEATSQASKASVATSQSAAPAAQSEAPAASPASPATAESTAVSSEAAAESTAAVEPKVSVEKAASQAASLATASKTPNAVAKSEANSTLAAAQSEVNKGYADFRKSGESGFRSFDPQTGKTTVTKENFLDYFRLNGSATYNSYDGIVTITPDENYKTGNFSLKSKINMNQSFKLTGGVNLGDKTQERGGADGIGFAFHTGNTTDLGANGGNLGIGGLRNATGFKLDTFSNVYQSPQGDTTNADSFQNGWAEDPALGQFGAWVNTTYKKIETQGQPAREYHLWWAETDAGSAQRLDSRDLDGRFHRFAIQYDGVTKELTVSYESNLGIKQWKKKVSTPEQLMSMVVTATTGTYKNLQQFQIKRFDFYQSASVDVRYVDEQGREIAEGSVTYPQGAFKGKPYTTEQKTIPGYSFIRMGIGSLPPSGTLADWDTNGTVTYVYRKGATDTKTERQTVSRTIKYRYRDGVNSGRPALPRPVTQTVEFTRQVVGGRPGPWTPARQNFGGVNTPSITGFTPDRTRVDGITVNASSTPGTEIVYYDKNAPKVTTETKDVTRTVAYEYEDGVTSGRPALPREVQQNVQFTRQVSEDPVTGAKTYGNWTPARQTVAAVDSPEVAGFTPNKPRVDSASVSPTDPSWREIVSYRKNDPKVTTETKDVTRTVAYEYEDGVTAGRTALPREVQQNVQFTRQVSEDPVTGAKTYGNWTPARQTVAAVDSPEVAGFTPNKPRVDSVSVSPTDPSWREIVSYAPATQRGTIVYRTDGKNGVEAKTLHTDNVTGNSNTPINYTTTAKINEFKQLGYDLVSDGFTKAGGQKFDSNNNVDQKWEVVLTPRIETKQEKKDVTRNVRYQYKDGVTAGRPALPRPVTQTTSFTRPVSVNKVTGVETPGQWNKPSEELPKVDSPAVTGFTPDKPSVPAATVTPTSPNEDEVVSYSQDDQRGIIEYVTDGPNGVPVKTLYTDGVTGKSGEPVAYSTASRIAQLQQAGYKLVSDGFTQPSGQKFDNDKKTDQVWKVVVTPVVETTQETKNVTRTIQYQYGDGVTEGRPALPPTVTQPVTFTRPVSVNKVTGVETPGQWNKPSEELPKVDSPAVTGFTPDKPSVPAATVTPTSPNEDEVVSYSQDDQRGIIEYVTDGQNGVPAKTLYTDGVTGKSGEDVVYSTASRIAQLQQAGYKLVSDGFTQPSGQKFDNDKTKDQVWKVVVTPVVETTQETKNVTRTIQYQYGDGVTEGRPALPPTVTQPVTFTRPVSVNKVTGEKTPGAWDKPNANLPEVTSPAITGYSPDKPKVPGVTVDPTSENPVEVVKYNLDEQRGSIKYVTDGKNGVPAKTLYTDGVTGKSGEPVAYSTASRIEQLKQAGYTLVSDGFTKAGGQKFDSNNNVDQKWEVVLTPRIETKQERKDVTRNIRYQYKDGVTAGRPAPPRPVTQTTSFTRPVSVNKVTGVETPGQWNKPSEELPKVDSPAVTGFTPDKPSVPAATVTPTSPNEDEVVSYSQDDQRGIIEYVTDGQNGVPAKTLYTDGVTGKSGEDVVYSTASRIAQLQQAGYKLVRDGFTQPNGQKFDADKTQDQVWKVVVTPIIETRTETKRVLRIIEYQYGDGVTEGRPALPPTVTQPVTFTRPVSVNKVTGEKTPGAWDKPNANLPEVTSPAITGYSPDKPKVPGVTVDPTSENPVEVVKYNLDEQRGSIKYVTDGKNGVEAKTLYTDSVAGKSGEPVAYSTASRIEQLKQAGYKLVSDGFTQPSGQKFDNDKTKDQVWKVVVTPRVDDNTNPADLNSKVTRTIKYQYADGQTAGRPALKAPVTQEAAFTRTGERNRVTGKETFTAWTPATKELAQEATPVVTGFVADKANVAAKTVTPDDKDSEEVVQYKKAEVPPTPTPEPKPVPPTPAPVPNKPVPNKPVEPRVPGTTTLPNTGEKSSSVAVLGLGIVATLAGVSLIKPRLKED